MYIHNFYFFFQFQVLLLHRNNIEKLMGCDRFIPNGLTTLTLNGNDLTDLTEVNFLSGLTLLEQLTLADNPCILQPEDESKQYDYRPYVINWCLGLRVLDGVMVGAKERWAFLTFFLFKGFYRPGQANLQFSHCQNLGILANSNNLKCGIFSKIKIQGFQNDQNDSFWPPKSAK